MQTQEKNPRRSAEAQKEHAMQKSFLSASPRLCVILFFALAACKPTPVPPKEQESVTLAVPQQGAYAGAYMDFGDNEDDVTLETIEGFEQLVGKHQAIIASSSYWGEQSFPAANLNIIWRHHSIPLVFWSPWDRPYVQECGPDRFSLTSIIEGKWDDYIDHWGDAARAFGHPIFVSFANEMNGTWFPWSGIFYGGNTPVPGEPVSYTIPGKVYPQGRPGPFQGPETFKKAYRHVVDRVRARGASNVLWVFHTVNYSIPQSEWNFIGQYYPGPDYVDWLGYSVYGEQFQDEEWCPFIPLLDWPYREICALDPDKPIMLAEWGVGEFSKKGSKPDFIRDALGSIQERYPRIKAAVFWHERWQNPSGNYSNLRANSSPESLAAYRHGIANPFWLDKPQMAPANTAHPSPGQSR